MNASRKRRLSILETVLPDLNASVMSRTDFELFMGRIHLIYGEPGTPAPVIDKVPTRAEFDARMQQLIEQVYKDTPPWPEWSYDKAEALCRANEPPPEPLPPAPPKRPYTGYSPPGSPQWL